MIKFPDKMRVLTVFAHPDDETLAAGGTLAKLHDQDHELFAAIPNTGIHSRRNSENESERNSQLEVLQDDCHKALSTLGFKKSRIHLGNFSDNEIDKHTLLELIHWLEKIIDDVRPDLIFTHHRYCTNIDHRYCHEAVVVATRPSVSSHTAVVSAEVPSSTGYLKPTSWEPNLHIEISENNLNRKIEAMNTFSTEKREAPHPRSPEVLRALATVRGSESGFTFAESFMIQKFFA